MQFVVVFIMDNFVQQNAPAHASTAEDVLPDDEILPPSENEGEQGDFLTKIGMNGCCRFHCVVCLWGIAIPDSLLFAILVCLRCNAARIVVHNFA